MDGEYWHEVCARIGRGVYANLCRYWPKIFAVVFGIGVVMLKARRLAGEAGATAARATMTMGKGN